MWCNERLGMSVRDAGFSPPSLESNLYVSPICKIYILPFLTIKDIT